MVAEVAVLFGIEHFEQRRLRIAAEIGTDFVDLVDHQHRILLAGVADGAYDRAGHRPDVRAPVAANLGLVAHAADREAGELASHRSCDRLAERSLADAGRPDEAENRAGQLLFELADGQILDDAVFDLFEIVVIFVEDRARLLDVDVVGRLAVPRQRDQPVEIRANDAVFGAGLRHFRKTVEFAIGSLLHVLGHAGAIDLLAQLVEFGELRIDLTEFFLNRAKLLAQVELALILLHLALDVALDLMSQFDDFELLGEQHRELAHALGRVALFEQRLPIRRLQAHRGGDEIRQHRGIGDVLDLHLHLAGRLRQIREQFLEKTRQVPLHRDEVLVFDGHVGKFGVGGHHVRRHLRELLDLEDLLAGDDAAQRAVGHLEHLLNDADRPDALHVVGAGVFDLAVLEHRQADGLAFAQCLFDELDAGLLDHRKRNDGVRKQHRLLQRQNADDVGWNDGGRVLLYGHGR